MVPNESKIDVAVNWERATQHYAQYCLVDHRGSKSEEKSIKNQTTKPIRKLSYLGNDFGSVWVPVCFHFGNIFGITFEAFFGVGF